MNKSKIVDIAYLLMLAMSAGAVVILGVFVAPVVFHSEIYLSIPVLSRYEEGKMMGEIFRRFSFWGYFMVIFITFYELYRYKMMQIDKVSILSALGAVSTFLLFSAVYIPKILAYQEQGEAVMMDNGFETLHKASEIDFKILLATLLILFGRRAYLLMVKR